jgi:hypothetical protein
MRAWGLLAAIGVVLAAATPATAAPRSALRVEDKTGPRVMLVERARAAFSAEAPVGVGPAPAGLRLTTAVGGPASRERLEGRLQTTTKLVVPQLGCWQAWSRGFFLGLELGWAVASSRNDASDGRRDAGLSGLARPITSIVHFGWSQ